MDLIRYLGFPTLLGGAVGATAWALAAGHGGDVVVLVVLAVVTVALVILERVLPVYDAWNRSRGDVVGDGLHSIVALIVIPESLRILTFSGLVGFAAWAEAALGWAVWPRDWPWGMQVALALVSVEWAQYWVHRAQHAWPLLWRFHAVHHSARRLYWLNAGRVHPLEAVVNYLVAVPVLVALGCGAEPLAVYLVFISVCASAQHANVDFRLGPLNWVLSQGPVHRWHHAPGKADADHNFGVVLILWDLVFGTFKAPGDWPERVGIDPVESQPKGYVAQVLAPFSRRRRGD